MLMAMTARGAALFSPFLRWPSGQALPFAQEAKCAMQILPEGSRCQGAGSTGGGPEEVDGGCQRVGRRIVFLVAYGRLDKHNRKQADVSGFWGVPPPQRPHPTHLGCWRLFLFTPCLRVLFDAAHVSLHGISPPHELMEFLFHAYVMNCIIA